MIRMRPRYQVFQTVDYSYNSSGTYAHHAASRLAYQSSSTGAKAAQEFSQGERDS